jgi:hypothetical protein
MTSDSATAVASQQSVKAYADTKEATLVTQATASIFGTRTTTDSLSATLVHDEVYQVACDGFLAVKVTDEGFYIYSDGSNPPTTIIAQHKGDGNEMSGIPTPIRKDDYFKVTKNGDNTMVIYWLPIGTGACVKQ